MGFWLGFILGAVAATIILPLIMRWAFRRSIEKGLVNMLK